MTPSGEICHLIGQESQNATESERYTPRCNLVVQRMHTSEFKDR